jgi:radical SAM protein with 4Fe4S-binding SPASM domain
MKRFKKIYIEITNVCNLKCDFCPQSNRKSKFMDIETFTNILDQVKPYGEYLYFHVKGEPLLHPDIDKFLDYSYQKGFQVNITTNGTLIDKVKDKIIMKPALRQMNFSLHSLGGNEGDMQMQEYVKNIISFAKEATEKTKMIQSLRLWNLEQDNEINIEKNKNYDILKNIQTEFALDYEIQDKVTTGRGIKIGDRLYLNHDYEFQWPDLNEQEDDGVGFCYGLRNQIAILVDGTVVPCCLDGEGIINLGNIKNKNFSEIISSHRATDILDGFSRRYAVEELCRKCGYRRKFGLDNK